MNESLSTPGEIAVLVLSATPQCRSVVRAALGRDSLVRCKTAECERIDSALDQLRRREFDLILLDSNLNDVRSLRQQSKDAAIVFLSSVNAGGALAVDAALAAGATDCIPQDDYKDNDVMLWHVLRQTIRFHAANSHRLFLTDVLRERDTRIIKLTQELLAAPYDLRTGWHSHRRILDRLKEEFHRARRYHLPLTAVLFDFGRVVDYFDEDSESRASDAIRSIADSIRSSARPSDIIGHYGNDAFLILLTNTTAAGAERFCQRVNARLVDPFIIIDDEPKFLTCDWAVLPFEPALDAPVDEFLGKLENLLEESRQPRANE